jgi:geranylgeranyl diphosphate synthase type II
LTANDPGLCALTDLVEEKLGQLIGVEHPLQTDRAAAYSLLAGGKRIRPLLLLKTAAMSQVPIDDSLPFALALELIHTYSLIHDDLPAMDDDDLRRGRPSCHRAFDEATAILAGDLLLNLAYETVLQALLTDASLNRIEAAGLIAHAAGRSGMIAGQAMDLICEVDRSDNEEALDYLIRLQTKKTGALIEAAVIAGATLGGAPEDWLELLSFFSRALGRVFQLQDDLLDVTGSEASLGKTAGKDARDGKLTFVTLLGIDETKRHLNEQIQVIRSSLAELEAAGAKTEHLLPLIDAILKREA